MQDLTPAIKAQSPHTTGYSVIYSFKTFVLY